MPDLPTPSPLILVVKRLFSPFACFVWALVFVLLYFGVRLVEKKFDVELLGGSGHLLEDARKAAQQNDWPAALQAIQKIPDGNRHKPEFLRVLADYLMATRTEPAVLVDVLERLDAAGESKPEDSLWLSRAHLALGRPEPARIALERTPSGPESLDYLETKMSLLKSEGLRREAAEVENVIFNNFADDPAVAVRKAARELNGTFPEIQKAALARLWQIGASPDGNGLSSIRILGQHTGLTLPETKRLQQLAAKHPTVTLDDRLNIASKLLRLEPSQREALVQAEIEGSKDAGPDAFQRLIAWLASEKEFEKIVSLVPRDTLNKSKELFPAVAQDLAQRERWQELLQLLDKKKPLPVSNARAANWRALAAKHLHPTDVREARSHLEEAILDGAGKNDTHALEDAASLAEEWHMTDLALDASQKLAAPGLPRQVEMLEKCWQLASRLKRESVLSEVAERLARLKPDSFLFAKRHDYLRLLRGKEIEVTLTKSDSPSAASAASLLLEALKAYRLHDLAQASAALRKVHDTSDFSIGEKAVYAGLLAAACDEVSQAYQLAEKIRPELLLDEELVFLEMAL